MRCVSGIVVFADRAVGGGAGGVEVAQRRVAQAVGVRVVGQRVLDHQLREAVGIDRVLRMVFGDRHLLGNAVGGARAGEHDPLDAGRAHGVQQRERADDVVVVVLGRLA